jgi:hypothetical protein
MTWHMAYSQQLAILLNLLLLCHNGNTSCLPFCILFSLFPTSGSHTFPAWKRANFSCLIRKLLSCHTGVACGTFELPKPLENECANKTKRTAPHCTLFGTLLSFKLQSFCALWYYPASTLHFGSRYCSSAWISLAGVPVYPNSQITQGRSSGSS